MDPRKCNVCGSEFNADDGQAGQSLNGNPFCPSCETELPDPLRRFRCSECGREIEVSAAEAVCTGPRTIEHRDNLGRLIRGRVVDPRTGEEVVDTTGDPMEVRLYQTEHSPKQMEVVS